jgi:hypothetical protein
MVRRQSKVKAKAKAEVKVEVICESRMAARGATHP